METMRKMGRGKDNLGKPKENKEKDKEKKKATGNMCLRKKETKFEKSVKFLWCKSVCTKLYITSNKF